MKTNVGLIDRILRFCLALFLLWLGLIQLNGIEGNVMGILVAAASLLPITMTATGKCPVFLWLKIHSLSKNECKKHGSPYTEKEG